MDRDDEDDAAIITNYYNARVAQFLEEQKAYFSLFSMKKKIVFFPFFLFKNFF